MVCGFSSGDRDIKLKAVIGKLDSLSEDSRAIWQFATELEEENEI